MKQEHGPDQLKEAREKARREMEALDPSLVASRSGAAYSYAEGAFTTSFLAEEHTVTYPEACVRRADGSPADGIAELIIVHYLLNADGRPVQEEWVSYRDLPGARYHESAFVAEVESPLSQGFSGRLGQLRDWAQREARILDLPGDVAAAWYVLPRVPLLIIFNDADEEFPASARVLFDISAPGYLPTEDLSALAELAARRLLELVQAA